MRLEHVQLSCERGVDLPGADVPPFENVSRGEQRPDMVRVSEHHTPGQRAREIVARHRFDGPERSRRSAGPWVHHVQWMSVRGCRRHVRIDHQTSVSTRCKLLDAMDGRGAVRHRTAARMQHGEASRATIMYYRDAVQGRPRHHERSHELSRPSAPGTHGALELADGIEYVNRFPRPVHGDPPGPAGVPHDRERRRPKESPLVLGAKRHHSCTVQCAARTGRHRGNVSRHRLRQRRVGQAHCRQQMQCESQCTAAAN